MYSLVAFILIFGQLAVAGVAYMLRSLDTFYFVVSYGGPPYLIQLIFKHGFDLIGGNPTVLIMIGYHLFKYFLLFRAQIIDQKNFFKTFAMLGEVIYIGASWYYMPRDIPV